jgi:hypothetical protein
LEYLYPMRIFIGLTDVANFTSIFANGFKALDHEVFTVVWNKSRFYPDSQYDLVIDERVPGTKNNNKLQSYLKIILNLAQIIRAINCDLFIIYAPAVLPTGIIYPVLKLLGKKIITAFLGSDIRYWYAFAEEMKSLNAHEEMLPFFEYVKNRTGGSYWDKHRTVKVAEKYSDLIITQPDYSQLLSRPYMRACVPLDLSTLTFNVPARPEPLILHAPSVPEAKGTDIVLRVIEELTAEGLRFQFRLIENMPNEDLCSLLSEADIVVDELYSVTVGGLSSESMATGNAVLTRYLADFSKVPPDCPAINTSIHTLKDNLRQIILDLELRKKAANAGRPYVEANNDNVKVCKNLLNWVEHKNALTYDFYPSFYKILTIPEQILTEEKLNTKKRRRELYKSLFSNGTMK